VNCAKCKADIADNTRFCPQCGHPHGESVQPVVKYKMPPWGVLLIVLCLGLVVYVVALAYYNSKTVTKSRTGAVGPASQVIPLPQFHSVPVTNGALTVKASGYAWYTFTVPQGATTVSLLGHFTATGGSGNDIIVYVLDEDGFVNFKNGHPTRTFYNSGKVTQASIGTVLPNVPATYYLMFDNRFSLLTPKAVQVDATLNYMQ